MRKIGVRGFKVVQDSRGKATLEPIPMYGKTVSQKAQARKSKAVKVVRPASDHLWGKKK